MREAILFLVSIAGALAYLPPVKESLLSDIFLREIVNRMGRDLPDSPFMDFQDSGLSLGPRSIEKELEEDQQPYRIDYDGLGEASVHPSIRDREYLQQSSLWGNQFMSGGAGEGIQRLNPEGAYKNKQEIKTDVTLPAYCNPPNPCPLGYTGEQGCFEEFENTASFSRRYQAAQDCMCDSEHMFDCPSPEEVVQEDETIDALNDLEFNRFLQRTLQGDPSLQHKNLVAKKYSIKKSFLTNPFLAGERLPVAAKKGHKMYF